MQRTIVHLDLDAFFASVEELLDPSIAGKPIIVGGSPEARGVVSSASYAARAYGVRSAMPTSQALRLCPQAILLPGHRSEYSRYSRRVMRILREYTPLVEPISIDEAFLDVTGTELRWGPPDALARTIQERIQRELGLSASVGVASNKLVAKIASGLRKPRGLVVVPPGQEAAFLAPLPIEMLWGLGQVMGRRLKEQGIETIGQLAALPDEQLKALFGEHGRDIRLRAQGIDHRPVETTHEPKSVGHEYTFARDVGDLDELRRTLLALSDKTAARLRAGKLRARTITLKLRYPDFTTITRSTTLPQPTNLGDIIYEQARALLEKVWHPGTKVRLLGVATSNLETKTRQLSLFETSESRLDRLSQAVDEIRRKYGEDAITRASLLQAPEDNERY